MLGEDHIWREPHTIKSYQITPNALAKPGSILEFFQEAAGNHANHSGYGIRELMQTGRVWVLSRLRFEVMEMPKWLEKVQAETWIKLIKGPASYRDYIIRDHKGTAVIKGSTMWMGIHQQKRRPVSLEDLTVKAEVRHDLQATSNPARLKLPAQIHHRYSRTARYTDLDMVGHVNNIRYLDWVLDSYPVEVHQLDLKELEVNFLAETLLEQEVDVQTQVEEVDGEMHLHSAVIHKDDQRVSCVVISRWKKR